MNTDPIRSIRKAEREAEGRIAAARQAVIEQRQETEQKVEQRIAQTEAEAQGEAAARKQCMLTQAEERALALRKLGRQQAEALRHTLLQRTPEAAERIVNTILPRVSSC